MRNITFLGLGAMGSRMATNLIGAGYQLTVWNRSPEAAAPLVALGARQCLTPAEAARDADVVIAMVRDNAASREVWLTAETGALAGMPAGTIAIESSTLTAAWVRELAGEMAHHGMRFLEAPVSGSRPQAQGASLVWFVGGDEQLQLAVHPLLMAMGAAIHYTGDHGSAALTKLATNTLMGVQVTALAEIIGLLTREGADVARVLNAVSGTSCWSPLASGASGSMLNESFSPQFPAELIEKDFGYFLEGDNPTQPAPVLTAARGVFRQAMDEGIGNDNMTGVVRLFTR